MAYTLLAFSLVLLVGAISWAKALFFGPLRNIPGPLIARLSNFWMVKQTLDGTQHHVWDRLHKKYGNSFPLNFAFCILYLFGQKANVKVQVPWSELVQTLF